MDELLDRLVLILDAGGIRIDEGRHAHVTNLHDALSALRMFRSTALASPHRKHPQVVEALEWGQRMIDWVTDVQAARAARN